ncbi:MAG: Glu-tRNA(Gln) amidotransferase subunit GatE [Candidatus Hodarchaeota archaeon]
MVSDSNHSDSSYDYERLGFRAGLEIHAQIKSDRKLFCHCKPMVVLPGLKPDYTFERRFRPVLGEMGDYDAGMIIEYEKDYRVFYYTFPPPFDVCSYEFDETPPFFPDQVAIDTGFYLAHYYNCQSLVDEVIFNRKQYLDGSITTGFQRTAVLGKDGWIIVNGKKIRISNFNVEEDAARRVDFNDRTDRNVYFNLDRLSIPLVEIITNHEDCDNPKDLHDLALLLGLGLRITGKGVRGIGSIRQDVNISIKRGDRVELKGVQDLKMLQTYVDLEIQRQIALIEIMDELKKRGIQEQAFEHFYIDVSAFVDSIVDLEKEEGWDAFAIRLPKCAGLFKWEVQPGRSFGLELFDKAELISGLPVSQMFHSDDFSAWAKGQNAEENFKEILGLQDGDAFIITIGSSNRAIHALKKIVERMKMALDGVPQETRRVLPNGNSEFLRVIHGKDRLYPDTDTQGIPITPDRLERIFSEYQPPKPWNLVETTDLSLIEVALIVRDNLLFSFFINLTKKLALPSRKAFGIVQNLHRLQKDASASPIDWEEVISRLIEWLESGQCSIQDIVPILEVFAIGWEAEQIIGVISAQSEQLEPIKRFIIDNAKKVWDNTVNVTKSSEETNRAVRRMMHLIKNSFEVIFSQQAAKLVLEYWTSWKGVGG